MYLSDMKYGVNTSEMTFLLIMSLIFKKYYLYLLDQ